ncbi:MAG: lipocalin-like domain-containing protein [bacterium]
MISPESKNFAGSFKVCLVVLGVLWTFFSLPSLGVDSAVGKQYRNAVPGYNWVFPRDHGSHPNYRTEWWYFTGELESNRGKVGYQFTIFRQGTGFESLGENRWMSDQLFLGHMAVSVPKNSKHVQTAQFSRGGKSLAEADTQMPGLIRLRNWTLRWENGEWRIKASRDDIHLELSLEPEREPLLQGPGGYSRKGADTGQASLYYSFTRLKTSGTIRWGKKELNGTGRSWFDHEFGSSQLSDRQTGWDWISVRMNNGNDLMVYRLREKGGKVSESSQLTIRTEKGTVRYLSPDEWNMTPDRYWVSSTTGTRYPVKWTLEIPSKNINLIVEPIFDRQEMNFKGERTQPYWEGMITVDGQWSGQGVTGQGYLEMTGYGGDFNTRF